MRLRTFLSLTVLTAALLFTLLTGSTTKARECPWQMCVDLYNECEASCNGGRTCIKACQRDYSECQCANCGLCSGPIPRANLTSGVGGAKVNGYVSQTPASSVGGQ